MENTFLYTLDNTAVENCPVSFSVYKFLNELVKVQNFEKSTRIVHDVKEPGMYHAVVCIHKDNTLLVSQSEYQYFPPEKCYNLASQINLQHFENEVSRSHKRLAATPFQGKIGNQIFDFLFFPDTRKNLFVLCPSAIIRGEFPVPYFYRWTWAAEKKFPGNVLVVSDPTFNLDPSLGAGWLIGTREEDATLYFSRIVKIFCKKLQINYRNLIFWGSSAGGFIAMQLAKHFPLSTAVSVNAQTDISKYNRHKLLYDIVFKGLSYEEINRDFGIRLNTVLNRDKFSKNTVFMIQNVLDAHHYQEHFLPFFKAVLNNPDPALPDGINHLPDTPFTTWVYSHPDSHMAETPEMAEKIINVLKMNSIII